MTRLSVLILARNEEHNIVDCIHSVLFADEILVIDDFSTDNTKSLAESCGDKVRVLQRSIDNDWSAQRNFALDQASGEWVLFLDADERVSTELAQEIGEIVQSPANTAYSFPLQNHFHHNRAVHGVFHTTYFCRLFPRKGTKYEGVVHEKVIHAYPHKKLKGLVTHCTYEDWDEYFLKFNRYTLISAEKYRSQGKKVSFFKDIVLRPIWAFIKVYLIHRGFLDGKLGWIFSVNHYFYTMTKYVRLYYLYKSNGKL